MRRWWWVVVALALVVSWIVAEIVAQSWLERRVAERVVDAAAGQVTAAAEVESFPVATGLALTGAVDRVEVGLSEVAGRGLGPVDVRFTVTGLRLDRSALLAGDLDVTGIDQGSFRAALDTAGLPSPVLRGLEFALDRAERFGVEVTQSGLRMVLPLIGAVELSLPVSAPCDPAIDLTGQDLVFACTFDQVPSLLTLVAAPVHPVASASNASRPPP